MRKLFLRSFALAFVAFSTFFGVEFFLEWHRAGSPGISEQSWAAVGNTNKLVDMLSPMARAYNNVLAMLMGLIGLAIPLTATMHTPKLIEIFLRDRINRIVLSFMAFGAAHALFVDYIIGPKFAPTYAVALSVFLAIVGWAILLPYFFYVVRFVDPSRLITRLRVEVEGIVERVHTRRLDPIKSQPDVSRLVHQLGTIIIKSLDRNDRDVAAEGVWAIKQLLDHYDRHKKGMPKEWFVVDRADFVGLSDEALAMLTENHTWYEMRCMKEIEHGFLRALQNANDSVSTFSDVTRVIATRAIANRDEQELRLCLRFFNTYLHEAIKARNLRAVYDVFHQYRRLGRELVDRPELLREIGARFSYYAVMARTYGMVFAPQLVLFDLGFVTRRAYERASPAAPDLLQIVLGMPHRTGNDFHSMAVKAKLILGGFFVGNGKTDEAELLKKNLADVSAQQIERARAELLAAEHSFFEVTDRQLNLEYVPDERRAPLERFCSYLTGSGAVIGA